MRLLRLKQCLRQCPVSRVMRKRYAEPRPAWRTALVKIMSNLRALHGVVLALISLTLANAAAAQEIRVTLLGTGTPIVNFSRFGMSTLVEAGSQKLLFDA